MFFSTEKTPVRGYAGETLPILRQHAEMSALARAQDTCYLGYIKGIGRLYQQTCIDTYSNVGFAKLYLENTSLTAADLMNDKVLPFFDQHGIRVLRVLTDRGAEYCGRAETHPYELYLHLNNIEHTKTKPRHPQTNGAV